MAAVTGTTIGKRLIEALGLPKHTIWAEFRIAHNEIVSVKCGYFPDLIDPTELVEVLAEFELHEKTPNVKVTG